MNPEAMGWKRRARRSEAWRVGRAEAERLNAELRRDELRHDHHVPDDTFWTHQFLSQHPRLNADRWWVRFYYKLWLLITLPRMGRFSGNRWQGMAEETLASLRPGIRRMQGPKKDGVAIVAIPSGRYAGNSRMMDDGSALIQINAAVFEMSFVLAKIVAPLLWRIDESGEEQEATTIEDIRADDRLPIFAALYGECLEAYQHGQAPFQMAPFIVDGTQTYGRLLIPAEEFVVAHEYSHLGLGHHAQNIADLPGGRRREMEFEADHAALQMVALAHIRHDAEATWLGCLFSLHVLRICSATTHRRNPDWQPSPMERHAQLVSWIAGLGRNGVRERVLELDILVAGIVELLAEHSEDATNAHLARLARPWSLPEDFWQSVDASEHNKSKE